jgi:hypothetical protein
MAHNDKTSGWLTASNQAVWDMRFLYAVTPGASLSRLFNQIHKNVEVLGFFVIMGYVF